MQLVHNITATYRLRTMDQAKNLDKVKELVNQHYAKNLKADFHNSELASKLESQVSIEDYD